MDKGESVIKVDDSHILKLVTFIKKILTLSNTERIKYFRSIIQTEIKLIIEIIRNFLDDNIQVDYKSYNLLKRLKNFLYKLVNKKISIKNKRKLLSTIKGIQTVAILFPLALNTFT